MIDPTPLLPELPEVLDGFRLEIDPIRERADVMAMAHSTGRYATVVFVAGALITGFTVLSTFTAVRVYLSEQFPTALRGRGQYFGESCGRLVAGVVAPFMLEPYTGSPVIFFGTLAIVASIGAFVPVLFGKETVGQLETVTEGAPEMA